MKKQLIILIFCTCVSVLYAQTSKMKSDTAKEPYTFSCNYRIEGGYIQPHQHIPGDTLTDAFLHGVKLGTTVNFNLPYCFSIQTGLFYYFATGLSQQHWRSVTTESTQSEYITKTIYQHQLSVPMRVYYDKQVWEQLSLFLFTGPQFQIGIAQTCKIDATLTPEAQNWLEQNQIHTKTYDRYAARELSRFNCQWSIGGGFCWDKYRLQAGYDFGLCNIMLQQPRSLAEWGWSVSFAYTIK